MAVRDEHQLAAFLNNGWVKCDEEEEKTDFPQHMDPPEEPKEASYTKTDINRLSTAELKDLATKEGLSDVENKSGADLKKELIEHYGL
jgi:hypothetical protein